MERHLVLVSGTDEGSNRCWVHSLLPDASPPARSAQARWQAQCFSVLRQRLTPHRLPRVATAGVPAEATVVGAPVEATVVGVPPAEVTAVVGALPAGATPAGVGVAPAGAGATRASGVNQASGAVTTPGGESQKSGGNKAGPVLGLTGPAASSARVHAELSSVRSA